MSLDELIAKLLEIQRARPARLSPRDMIDVEVIDGRFIQCVESVEYVPTLDVVRINIGC